MRRLEVRCDACGAVRPSPASTWWELDDLGTPRRTGSLDFCALTCLRRWLDDAEVRAAYARDFTEGEGA